MNRRPLILALLGSLLLLVAACGDGGSGVATDRGGPPEVAGGGIGGTGKGTVSGYGSIIVNEQHRYAITGETELLLDGRPTTEQALRQPDPTGNPQGQGRVVTYVLADDANDELTSGTALSVHAEHRIVGPVTLDSPLKVLRQRVVTDAGTVLVGIADANDLRVDDVVAVSGHANPQNVVHSTRVELLGAVTNAWRLLGPVVSYYPLEALLVVGGENHQQIVDIQGVTPTGCDGGEGLHAGALVEVTAYPLFNGDGSITASGVRCRPAGIQLPPGSPAVLPMALEGLAANVTPSDPAIPLSPPEFDVDGQPVVTTTATRYVRGRQEDLVDGALVEVQGTLDTASGVLTARLIRFTRHRVLIQAPLGRVNQGESVTLVDVTVLVTELTKDPLGFHKGDQPEAQVRMSGYTVAGLTYANQITPFGKPATPDPTNILLRGPVDSKDTPPEHFTILGVLVNPVNAGELRGPNGQTLEPAEFIALLRTNPFAPSLVQVEGATYDNTFDGDLELHSAVKIRLLE